LYKLIESVLLGKPINEEPVPPAPPGADPNQQQQPQPGADLGPGTPPPDFTGGGDQQAPPAGPDPTQAAGGDPNQMGAPDPNAAAAGGADPNAQDPNAQGGEDPNAGMQEPLPAESPQSEIDNSETAIFSDLKPEQMLLKNTELKQRYQELFKAVTDTLNKINKVSRTSYDDTMIDFIIKKLTNLRTMISDSLVDAYPSRTYAENKTELQRFTYGFNYITRLITVIYESRIKRQRAISKMNTYKDSGHDPEEFPIFNRGYDVQ
jgi:hypothetical protein